MRLIRTLLNLRPVLATFTGSTILAGTAAIAAAAVIVAGIPPITDPPPATAAQEEATVLTPVNSPASTLLADRLATPPGGWSRNGELERNVSAPLPYSCPLPGIAPSVSAAQAFTVGSARIRVTAQAYTAGVGAEAMDLAAENAWVCAGSESTVHIEPLYGETAGVESRLAATSRSGVRSSVVSFRRGDVIIHVSGEPNAPLQNLAAVFDRHLAGPLGEACLNQESTAADAARNPFSKAGYTPLTRSQDVHIEDVPLPKVPRPDPDDKDAPAIKAVPLPAPVLVKAEAVPAVLPEHPVWPEMPEPVATPEAPKAPAAATTTSKPITVLEEDRNGPGCGWAFTGMKPLLFDAAAAEKDADAKIATAREELAAAAQEWAKSVRAYWASYASYESAAKEYTEYAAEVEKVNAAWALIEADWETYRAELAAYDAAVAALADVKSRQAAAKAEYAAEVGRCERESKAVLDARKEQERQRKKAEASPSPSPTPSASPSPEPSETPPPEPSPSPTPTFEEIPEPAGCPAVKPAVLDEPLPELPGQPQKPKDPRP